jgi:hypothetical protein
MGFYDKVVGFFGELNEGEIFLGCARTS